MQNEYLISIGYPIGIVTYEEKKVGIIDNGDKSVILDPKSFFIWKIIFECIKFKDLSENYLEVLNLNKNDINYILNYLVNNNVLLKLNGEYEISKYYEIFKEFRLSRQGSGLGIDKNDTSKFRVITDRENILDPIEFTIWSGASRGISIKEIYENSKDYINKSDLMLALLRLYNIKLIYFMR